jgi:hypothetical protein
MKLSKDPVYIEWLLANKKPHGSSRMLTYNGQTKSINQWAAILGLAPSTLRSRLARGYTIEEALTTGIQVNKHQ